MKVQNELAAKVIGEIISKGMSLSEVDLQEMVKNEATAALGEIKTVMKRSEADKNKLGEIRRIMEKYNIG